MSKFMVKREEKPGLSSSKYRNVRLEPLLTTPPSSSKKAPPLTSISLHEEYESAFVLRRSLSKPGINIPKSSQNVRVFKLWNHLARRYLKHTHRALHEILLETLEFKLEQLKKQEITDTMKRNTEASLRIQSWWRGFTARKQFKIMKRRNEATVQIQTVWRGFIAKQLMRDIKMRNNASVLIQTWWRGCRERKRYRQLLHAVTTVQNIWSNMTRNRVAFKKVQRSANLITASYR